MTVTKKIFQQHFLLAPKRFNSRTNTVDVLAWCAILLVRFCTYSVTNLDCLKSELEMRLVPVQRRYQVLQVVFMHKKQNMLFTRMDIFCASTAFCCCGRHCYHLKCCLKSNAVILRCRKKRLYLVTLSRILM